MNSLDWIFVVILALLGIRCMAKGFVAEILSMAGFIVGILAALLFYRSAGELLVSWGLSAKPESLPEVLGFIATFLVAFLVMKLIGRLISEGVEAAELGGIDRALGLVLGLAEGLLLVCILLIAMSLLEPAFKSFAGYSKLLRDSCFARVILPIVGPEVVKATQGINAPELKLRLDPPSAKKQ
jgi:membrane protein required for colicin V production